MFALHNASHWRSAEILGILGIVKKLLTSERYYGYIPKVLSQIEMQQGMVMQIKVKGEMTLVELRQALFEKLNEVECELAVRHSRGATLYINPTNGFGDAVEPRKGGRKVDTLYSDGPYRSAADDFKL